LEHSSLLLIQSRARGCVWFSDGNIFLGNGLLLAGPADELPDNLGQRENDIIKEKKKKLSKEQARNRCLDKCRWIGWFVRYVFQELSYGSSDL